MLAGVGADAATPLTGRLGSAPPFDGVAPYAPVEASCSHGDTAGGHADGAAVRRGGIRTNNHGHIRIECFHGIAASPRCLPQQLRRAISGLSDGLPAQLAPSASTTSRLSYSGTP
jgi:hypothetical protein